MMTGEDAEYAVVGEIARQKVVQRLLIPAGRFDVERKPGIE